MTLQILHEEQVLRSQDTDIPLVPAHWQGSPGVPFVLKQESFQDSSDSATRCAHLPALPATLWLCFLWSPCRILLWTLHGM